MSDPVNDPTVLVSAEVPEESGDPLQHDTDSAGEPASEVTPLAADPVLLAARDQARAALSEITPADSIGGEDGHEVHEAHVLTLFFTSLLPGYPGWRWAATLARTDDSAEPTVLEVEMLPSDAAVVAPEWVPWSERLASYRESQARQASEEAIAAELAAAELSDEDDVDPDEDLLENDFSDFDDEIDGVDIDGIEDDDADDEDDDADDDELDSDGEYGEEPGEEE